MAASAGFDFWRGGQPVVEVADSGNFNFWRNNQPILQTEAIGLPEGIPIPFETTSFVKSGAISFPFEVLQQIGPKLSIPIEAKATLAAGTGIPHENTGAILLQSGTGIPFESLQSLRTGTGIPYEFRGFLVLVSTIPFEALQQVPKSVLSIPIEWGGTTVIRSGTEIPFEALQTLRGGTKIPIEWGGLTRLEVGFDIPIEVRGTLQTRLLIPFEAAGLSVFELSHRFNIIHLADIPLLHQFDIVREIIFGSELEHKFDIVQTLLQLIHEFRILKPDIIDLFNANSGTGGPTSGAPTNPDSSWIDGGGAAGIGKDILMPVGKASKTSA